MDTWTVGWISVITLLLGWLYRYLTKPFNYWKARGVPSVPAVPVFGSMAEMINKPVHEVILERYKKYGKVHGLYEGIRPALSVGDPDLLKNILLKDFSSFVNRREINSGDRITENMVTMLRNEKWKRVRTIITPAFSSGKMKRMANIMLESAKITAKNFEEAAKSGKFTECKRLFGTFAMDVIARSAFGTKLDSHNDPDNEFVRKARLAFTQKMSLKFLLFFAFPSLAKYLGSLFVKEEVSEFFENLTTNILKQRRETGQKKNDFLQLLMDASDEATKENGTLTVEEEQRQKDEAEESIEHIGHDHGNSELFKFTKKYKAMTHDELIAQSIAFFLAGYETTASSLTYVAYLLALHPEWQEKLIQEIDDTLRKHNMELTYEAVQGMKLMDKVIWESLRIHPPVIGFDRTANEDYKLGDTGITIPKGMVVNVPVYAMHLDPEYFKDPEKFDPERFSPEGRSQWNPYAYAPFGAGPRNCVGMRFALIEMKFCLALLLSKFRFKRCPETKVPLTFRFSQGFLVPEGGITLAIKEREDKVCDI